MTGSYIADTGDLSVVIYDSISTKDGQCCAQSNHCRRSDDVAAPADVSLDKVKNLLYVAG